MHIEHFKKKLEAEYDTLEKELGELGRKNPSNTDEWEQVSTDADPTATELDEIADHLEEEEAEQGELDALTARWREVKQALEHIELGTYGTCGICGEEIEEERLEANPAAVTCLLHKDE